MISVAAHCHVGREMMPSLSCPNSAHSRSVLTLTERRWGCSDGKWSRRDMKRDFSEMGREMWTLILTAPASDRGNADDFSSSCWSADSSQAHRSPQLRTLLVSRVSFGSSAHECWRIGRAGCAQCVKWVTTVWQKNMFLSRTGQDIRSATFCHQGIKVLHVLVTATALATYKVNTAEEQEAVKEKLPYALNNVTQRNKKLLVFKSGSRGRARHWDVEISIKLDQSPELFTLVNNVATRCHSQRVTRRETDRAG